MASFEEQSIGLPSLANARELGGYAIGGRRVRRGLLLRGGSTATASSEDLDALSKKFRVVKVFDFRTSMERTSVPDKDVEGAINIWLPAFDEQSGSMQKLSLPGEAYRDLGPWLRAHMSEQRVHDVPREMYLEMVRNEFTQVQYAGFFQNILSTRGGAVYWHCSQGKDRTGLGAALLLFALGADRELVMQDFCLSNEYYADELRLYLVGLDDPADRAVIQTLIGVNPEYFAAALDLVDSLYGSMQNFLTGPLCLSEEDIAALREYYLEPIPTQ